MDLSAGAGEYVLAFVDVSTEAQVLARVNVLPPLVAVHQQDVRAVVRQDVYGSLKDGRNPSGSIAGRDTGSSTLSGLGRFEVAAGSSGGCAPYPDALVDGVAEAVGVAGDELGDAVDAFAGGVSRPTTTSRHGYF
jgi:hypothetical protein